MDEDVVVRSQYTIRTPAFEGPFALLLELIEKRKLLVNEFSLSQVTDDFIQHVRSQAEFPIEDAADFIQVAATLLLIKSRSLLPELELSEEEEQDVEDLKRRLIAYEKTREAAKTLTRLFGRNVMVSAGERTPEVLFSPAKDMRLETLASALRTVLLEREKEEVLPEARVKPMVTIEEMMDRLLTRVQKAMTMSFRDFSGDTKEKVEVIVSFLALLELVKQGAVDVLQHDTFADIRITNTSTALPKYG